jgi:hypothetical protein
MALTAKEFNFDDDRMRINMNNLELGNSLSIHLKTEENQENLTPFTGHSVSSTFPIADLIENIQRYYEIFSLVLPICTVSTAVKVMY